ncbi:MAG: 16S rRNA (cytidine(1402)-2'-O)-methyltransferase [Myxococcota bacterium]|nr:16S rRNA (cytidine(1402)-2'-O)-methyltransferase [Myxococcota bacterium]
MGELYLVATPIGNLEDVTLRSLRLLAECDALLAEDTRRTRVLLDRHGIARRPVSLQRHNEAKRTREVLERLAGDARVVLVSDAGTPLVSDPGGRLVAAAIEAGHRVVPVPGPSAALAALVSSGLPTERFTFIGFPPRRAAARKALFESYAGRPETLVLFESPVRLGETLGELSSALGERQACVARELTKLHEELRRGSLGELARELASGVRGEVTLVVAGAPETEARYSPAVLDAAIAEGLAGDESPRDLARRLAGEAGWPRRDVYARVLSIREAGAESPEDEEGEVDEERS